MIKTELKLKLPFWAMVKSGDVNGYHTGKESMQTALYEFETATELNDFLASGSVESGESMGDFLFNVLKVSHNNLNELETLETQAKEEADAEKEYQETNALFGLTYENYLNECTALSFQEWKEQGGC
jgi:hypothetical protein